jgi:hypothetical protein
MFLGFWGKMKKMRKYVISRYLKDLVITKKTENRVIHVFGPKNVIFLGKKNEKNSVRKFPQYNKKPPTKRRKHMKKKQEKTPEKEEETINILLLSMKHVSIK